MKLYRKDANGNINVWYAEIGCDDSFTGDLLNTFTIVHGRLGRNLTKEVVKTNRAVEAEIKSRYSAKYKQGYKSLDDVKDNCSVPVKGSLIDYLNLYLPHERTTSDGSLLPMLAKVYDNTNDKVFKACSSYIGQWKINGLRCFIRAKEETAGLFHRTYFTFQSREGTYWNSLDNLSDYLLINLPRDLINGMLYEDWVLDGELYIPGLSINEINSAVKNTNNPFNRHIQFWCYDIAIPDTVQQYRNTEMVRNLFDFRGAHSITKEWHYNNKNRLICLPSYYITCDEQAIQLRNDFIDAGFEGLIMRNPELEYEYGKRKMIKYKKSTDGIFKIIDIIPEGIKRSDIAKFVCKNDINDATFECKLSASIDFQKEVLKNKDKYIDKTLFIEYGERTGVNALPFHLKNVRFNG